MKLKRIGVILILLLAFCGLADSAYLYQQESVNAPLICNVENLSGCNVVAASHYSRLFGVSIAGYGLVFYGAIFVIAALEIILFHLFLRRVIQWLAFAGFAASLYFTFNEVFLIKALCIYCLASAFITLLILIFATFLEPIRPKAIRA